MTGQRILWSKRIGTVVIELTDLQVGFLVGWERGYILRIIFLGPLHIIMNAKPKEYRA